MSLAQVVPCPHFRFPVYPLPISFFLTLQLTVSVYVNFPFFDAVFFFPLGTLLVATLVTLCHSFIYNEVCVCVGGNWMMLLLANVSLNQYLLRGSNHAPFCSALQ